MTDLSPFKALVAFTLSLFVSAALLFGNTESWAPIVPIALYGVFVAASQRRKDAREFGATVKDSPYFLGFILTLLGLVKIFTDVGVQSRTGAQPDVASIVGQAGAALLATIVGLFLRQIIWSYDKVENAREAVFQDLSKSLRDQAEAYQQQQASLVKLIDDFITSRTRLFEREQIAHSAYMDHVEQTNLQMDRFNAEYPERIKLFVGMLGDSGKTIGDASMKAAQAITESGALLTNTYVSQGKAFVDAVNSTSGPIKQAGATLANSVSDFEKNLGLGTQKVATSFDDFARAIGETPAALTATADSLKGLRGHAEGLEASMSSIKGSTASIELAVAELLRGLTADTQSIHAEVLKRAETLRKDMIEIDTAFTELLDLMKRRLDAKDVRLNVGR